MVNRPRKPGDLFRYVLESLMRLTLDDLLVSLDPDRHADIGKAWHWLLPTGVTPIVAAMNGNLFVSDSEGAVHLLDTGCATINRICNSTTEFSSQIRDPKNANEWLTPQLVGDLISNLGRPPHGSCFGYKLPPVFGGTFEIDNFEHTELMVHFGLLGQFAERVRNLPDGTPINSFTIVDEKT